MAQESDKVGIVREILDSINGGDLDRALEAAQEDFEADWSNSIAPHRGVYRGRQQVRMLFESFLEAWEEFRWDGARGAQLWTITGGKVRSVKIYQSRADALEAVGLRD